HQREVLAQRQIAEWIAVLYQVRAVLARERAQTLADAHLVHPGIGQPRSAREHGVFACIQESTNEPNQFLVALLAIGRCRSSRLIADRNGEKACPAPRL